MKTARAAVLEAFEQPLELRSFPLPEHIEPGGALVRVEMAGICGTDVHLWKGQLAIPLPVILGHETVGRIERLGEHLEKDWLGNPLRAGDRITWAASLSCGACYYCRLKQQPTRCLHRKAYGISFSAGVAPHLQGGYAEYIYLRPGTAVFKLPDGLDNEEVVGAGCALTTALHGLERVSDARRGMQRGDRVVIQGAGPVALAVLALLRHGGAHEILVIGGPAHRLDLCRRFGADFALDLDDVPRIAQRQARILERLDGFGADLVVECVGLPAAVPEGLEFCRDGGTYLVLGHYGDAGTVPLNPHVITRKQLRLVGSWGYEPRHVAAGLEFLTGAGKQFPFRDTVTHRFPLAEANQALAATREWRAGKSVIEPAADRSR